VQAQPPPSSVGSSTRQYLRLHDCVSFVENPLAPSSVDYHDHKSSAPPRLNLDFGTHSSLSGDTNSDPSSSGRTSVDSARATPPMVLPHLNTHTATPSPQLSSASSSIARRSLQAENPRMRAPLSQLTFPQNSITNTSSSSISGSNNVPGTPISQTSTNVGRRIPKRAPLVYPALLSRVADALLRRLPLSVRVKDGLSYPDAFDGREAVDKICYIIKTTDRSLALLLGRALDAQKFFHDVTYDHRLRDNPVEIYQFRSGRSGLGLTTSDPGTMGHTRGDSLSMSAGSMSHRPSASKSSTIESSPHNGYGDHAHYSGSEVTVTNSQTPHDDQIPGEANNMGVNEMELPTGVFTMLTECYSATCTRDQICYSITCPRRMEQQARANMLQRPGSAGGRASNTVPATPKAGRRATIDNGSGPTSPIGSMSGHGHGTQPQAGGIGGVPRMTKNADGEAVGVADDDDDRQESGQLWIHSVPKEVADALSDQEKKRQEAINEVIYTERDFVRDMEYLRDVSLTFFYEQV
jgi:RHO1 GDP-GTP exchange protein 1/2